MIPFEYLTILYFQILAALMMGWDYFMPEYWRKKTDGYLAKYFVWVNNNVNKDHEDAIKSLKLDIPTLLISLVPCIVIYMIFKSNFLSHFQFSPLAGFIIMFICLVFIFGGLITFLSIISPLLLPLSLSGIFKVITKFLISTEKGPLSGLGFLCLLFSFMMQYVNYKLV